MNEAFWIAEKKRFAFALDKDNHVVDEPSVLPPADVFGLLDEAKADAMITQLADLDHSGLGHADYFEHSPQFSAAATIRVRLAALTGWRPWGVSLSPFLSCLREFPSERSAGPRWLAWARHGSALGFLLPIACHELAASDLVRGNVVSPMRAACSGCGQTQQRNLTFEPHAPAD